MYRLAITVALAALTACAPTMSMTPESRMEVSDVDEARQAVDASPGDLDATLNLVSAAIRAFEGISIAEGAIDGPELLRETSAALDTAEHHHPDDRPRLRRARGVLLLAADDYDAALPHLHESFASLHSPEAVEVATTLYFRADRGDDARALCRTAVDATDHTDDTRAILRSCFNAAHAAGLCDPACDPHMGFTDEELALHYGYSASSDPKDSHHHAHHHPRQ